MAASRRRTNTSRSRQGSQKIEPRQSVRRPSSSGPPTIVVILGVFAVVAALGWGFMSGVNDPNNAGTMIEAARRAWAAGDSSNSIENKLRMAEKDPKITSEQRQEIRTMFDDLKIRNAEVLLRAEHMVGSTYLQKKLKNYSDKHLSGAPDHPKARVFMERCALFRKRWPKHPEMDWVDRQERRFAGFIDLKKPPTWPDMAWKVESLTYAKPRDYRQAFEALDAFILTASSDDKIVAQNRRKVLVADRAEYHLDRMQQARFELETNNDRALCVLYLVHGITDMGDPAMASEAAGYLLAMDNVEGHLRAYRDDKPLLFELLMQNKEIANFVAGIKDF